MINRDYPVEIWCHRGITSKCCLFLFKLAKAITFIKFCILQSFTYLKHVHNIRNNLEKGNDFLSFSEKLERTFIMTLNQLLSTRRKPVNARQKAAAEMIVLIVWYSANARHNCALVATSARIKRFKSTSGHQDYRDL